MKRIIVNITTEDGELMSRFFVLVKKNSNIIKTANSIEDMISMKYAIEDIE